MKSTSVIVMCKQSSEDDAATLNSSDRHKLLGYCTVALSNARLNGDPVIHAVSNWPPRGHFVPACMARQDEPIYCIEGSSLLNNENLLEWLLRTRVHHIRLIGILDAEIYRDLMARASTLNISIDWDTQSLVFNHTNLSERRA